MMEVRVQYFEACPHWHTLENRLKALRDEIPFDLVHELVDSPEKAEETRFVGSPTVLVDGRDPFAEPSAAVGLSCRIFTTPDGPAGSPTIEQLRTALNGAAAS